MPHQDQGRVASAIGPALDWLVSGEAFGSYTLRRNSRFTHAREVIASHTHDQRQSVTY